MKKFINILLILAFQFGYLEWGKGSNMFIFQAEKEIFSKAGNNPATLLHPFILLPLAGIVILIYTLFQPAPRRLMSTIGLGCLSLLMLLLLFIGVISVNGKILLSTVPFLVVAFLFFRIFFKRK